MRRPVLRFYRRLLSSSALVAPGLRPHALSTICTRRRMWSGRSRPVCRLVAGNRQTWGVVPFGLVALVLITYQPQAIVAAAPVGGDSPELRDSSWKDVAGELAPSAAADALPIGAAGGQGDELLVFPSEEELSVSLAKYTADLSHKRVLEKGAFTVVLSGGYLIHSLRKLVESPHAESVEWARWHVFWVDERVVKKDNADSNYKLAYDGFLSKVPIPPGQVYAINDSLPPEGAANDYEACLKHLVKTGVLGLSAATGFPRFDLMLLGMGPDGHVASLFPHHPQIKERTRWVTFIKDSPKPPPKRITFTFPVINSSANIAMVVAGPGEVDAVCRALGTQRGSSDLLPVQMISLGDGKMTWFTDKEAVSKLHGKSCP